MLGLLRRHLSASLPSVGTRLVYAVGDIHGRLDLLNALLHTIRADVVASQATTKPYLIFLGDYVDRGPQSRAVIDALIGLEQVPQLEVICLLGNHEAALLAFLDKPRERAQWLGYGGAETLAAYGLGLGDTLPTGQDLIAVRDAFAVRLPPEHLSFLRRLVPLVELGDYIFVHAGLRPGVPLAKQTRRDMLWIRDDFLNDKARFEKVVVHGHTPTPEPHLDKRRIGVDTGAYATGLLTAIRLQDTQQRVLQARI